MIRGVFAFALAIGEVASAADAAIIYQKVGFTSYNSGPEHGDNVAALDLAPGNYRVSLIFDRSAPDVQSLINLFDEYDEFVGDAQVGGNEARTPISFRSVNARSWVSDFTIQDAYSVNYGPSPLYPGLGDFRVDFYQTKYLGGAFFVYSSEDQNLPFGYRYTLFSLDVPEPGSWAMMIAGFGLVGWSTRRPARRAAIAG